MKPPSPAARTILILTLVACAWRGCYLPFSRGAYSDSILQIDAIRLGLTYWPPLFGLAARLVAWLPGLDLEGAARVVAWLSGALVVPPLMALATRLYGGRAAFWAAVAWIASPIAMRWSLQGMTDMPMTALWTAAWASLVVGIEGFLPGLFPHAGEAAPAPRPREATQWMLVASLLGALATMTRYQGILLLPPLLWAVWKLRGVARALQPDTRGAALKLVWTLLPWIVVPVWLLRGGVDSLLNHFQQIGQRAGLTIGQTLLMIYWYQAEEFLMRAPYFFAYGLFAFMLYGAFRTRWATARLRWTGWTVLALTVVIVALQSVFSSFLERYLLPLVPFVCLYAGHGLATWERHNERRPARMALLTMPALVSALVFSALVAMFQGDPFLDLKQAARYLVAHVPDLDARRILSNETYPPKIGAVKLGFWLEGREVGRLFEPVGPRSARLTALQPGDIIVLVSAYGGMTQYEEWHDALLREMGARSMVEPPFRRRAWPLLPDIMQERETHQNPLALNFRYVPQHFETSLLEIPPRPTPLIEPRPPISIPPPDPENLRELERVRQEIQQMMDSRPTTGTTNDEP